MRQTPLVTSITNAALRLYVNHNLKRYGKMTRLEIDSQKKTMHIELVLDGESAPIIIEVGSYALTEEHGKMFLNVERVTTSRNWLTTLANEYLANRKIPIPKAAAIAL